MGDEVEAQRGASREQQLDDRTEHGGTRVECQADVRAADRASRQHRGQRDVADQVCDQRNPERRHGEPADRLQETVPATVLELRPATPDRGGALQQHPGQRDQRQRGDPQQVRPVPEGARDHQVAEAQQHVECGCGVGPEAETVVDRLRKQSQHGNQREQQGRLVHHRRRTRLEDQRADQDQHEPGGDRTRQRVLGRTQLRVAGDQLAAAHAEPQQQRQRDHREHRVRNDRGPVPREVVVEEDFVLDDVIAGHRDRIQRVAVLAPHPPVRRRVDAHQSAIVVLDRAPDLAIRIVHRGLQLAGDPAQLDLVADRSCEAELGLAQRRRDAVDARQQCRRHRECCRSGTRRLPGRAPLRQLCRIIRQALEQHLLVAAPVRELAIVELPLPFDRLDALDRQRAQFVARESLAQLDDSAGDVLETRLQDLADLGGFGNALRHVERELLVRVGARRYRACRNGLDGCDGFRFGGRRSFGAGRLGGRRRLLGPGRGRRERNGQRQQQREQRRESA